MIFFIYLLMSNTGKSLFLHTLSTALLFTIFWISSRLPIEWNMINLDTKRPTEGPRKSGPRQMVCLYINSLKQIASPRKTMHNFKHWRKIYKFVCLNICTGMPALIGKLVFKVAMFRIFDYFGSHQKSCTTFYLYKLLAKI